MSAKNPNHPVTQAVAAQWHKLAALAVAKAGGHIVITPRDIAAFAPGELNITVQELDDGIHLRIVNSVEAERLARREGGLPI